MKVGSNRHKQMGHSFFKTVDKGQGNHFSEGNFLLQRFGGQEHPLSFCKLRRRKTFVYGTVFSDIKNVAVKVVLCLPDGGRKIGNFLWYAEISKESTG